MTLTKPSNGVQRQCGECGRGIAKAHKVHLGTPLCQTCYQRLFKHRTCVQCAGPVRALAQDPEPICPTCRRAARVCLRCERPMKSAGLIFKGKPVCPSCAPYFREKKACPHCGALSSRLSRIVGVTEEQICDACRRKLTCATCCICGKHRERFALSQDGKALCKRCAAAPDAIHPCPDCGVSLGGAGSAPCLRCGLIRSFRHKAEQLALLLFYSDTNTLLNAFVEWVIARNSVNQVLGSLPRILVILDRVEQFHTDSRSIDLSTIPSLLTTEEFRRSGLFGMFLRERGFFTESMQERAESSDIRRIESALLLAKGKPWEKSLRKYAVDFLAQKETLSARTRRLYLRSALALLNFSEVAKIADLTSDHVKAFLKSKPGHRASLFPWVKFVKEITGHSLAIPNKSASKEPSVNAIADMVGRLVSAIRSASTKKARLAMVAKLLSVLYGVPLEKVLSMDRRHLDISDGIVRLQIDNDWVKIAAPVDRFLSDAADESRSGKNSVKLFPGRMANDGLSVSAVKYYLKRYECS